MDNRTIEWIHKSDELCLRFTFKGNFSEHEAICATPQWREALSSRPYERIIHIWDCRDMDDYDQEAKKIWIENCKKFRGQIDSIWLISNSMLINMGAKIISLVTYLDVRTVKSEADIYF